MANGIGYYNALLGRLFDNGTELPLRGGLNFVGFNISQSAEGYTIEPNAAGGAAASDVENDSGVSGATVKDALDALDVAPGATGAVTYNSGGGARAGSSWLTDGATIYALTALTFGATASAASTGDMRVPLNFSLYAGTANGRVYNVGAGTSGDTTWGNPTAGTRYYDAGTSGSTPSAHVWRGAGFANIGALSSSTAGIPSGALEPAGAYHVGYLNGARVCPPTQGANLASGANAVNMSGGANYFMPASTTATASTVVCGATGAATGACLSFYIRAQSHTVTIQDASGTSLRVVAAGENELVDVHWDTSTSKYANPSWKKAQ